MAKSFSSTANHLPEQVGDSVVSAQWGKRKGLPLQMDKTAYDAELLALEISGALLPPPELYEQVYYDLTAIRQAYPDMNEIHHLSRWVLGELIVGFTEEAWEEIQNGEYHGFDELNSEYGPLEMKALFSTYMLLEFEERYNPEYLAPLYAAAEGVTSARPNSLGGEGSDIEASMPDYTFNLAWGDCLSGCIFHHYWEFTVIDGSVTLVSQYGDPLPNTEQTLRVYLPIVMN
jgi:hypothetical protein